MDELCGVMDDSARCSSAAKQVKHKTATTTTNTKQQYQSIPDTLNNDVTTADDDMMYDIADEEVHFSRNVLNQYQPFTHTTPTTYYLPSSSSSSARRHTNFTDVSLNLNNCPSQTYHCATGAATSSHTTDPAQVEQIKSSRLLNSIGSRIRHGSNYLRAPKLVGEYLLGVTIQSWSEFFLTSQMMKAPTNRQQLTRRLLTNLSYFQGNYLCVSFVLIIYCILTSPFLMLAIILYLVALYLVTVRSAHGRHLRLVGYRFNLQQQYSFLTLISVPLLWVAGAPSAVFWVIGASFVVVGLHASMYGGLSERMAAEAQIGPISLVNGELVSCSASGSHSSTHRLQNGAFVNYDPIPGSLAGSSGCDKASVQYYNHYSLGSQYSQQQYLPLQSVDTTKHSKDVGRRGSNLFYANPFAQWMTFGSFKSATSADTPTKNPKTPEVKIISQDFAGLGRVYEV